MKEKQNLKDFINTTKDLYKLLKGVTAITKTCKSLKLSSGVDTQMRNSKKSKLFTTENRQTTMIHNKRARKEQQVHKITKQLTPGQRRLSPSIVTSVLNGLNSPIKSRIPQLNIDFS